jgi:hypothetical protein
MGSRHRCPVLVAMEVDWFSPAMSSILVAMKTNEFSLAMSYFDGHGGELGR